MGICKFKLFYVAVLLLIAFVSKVAATGVCLKAPELMKCKSGYIFSIEKCDCVKAFDYKDFCFLVCPGGTLDSKSCSCVNKEGDEFFGRSKKKSSKKVSKEKMIMRKEVLLGIELTHQPKLSAVSNDSITIKVRTNGCTSLGDFRFEVKEKEDVKEPVLLTVYKVKHDLCKMKTKSLGLKFSRSALGIKQLQGVKIENTIANTGLIKEEKTYDKQ